jgi:DNA-binding HxlR family transcriptional regulator
VLEQLLQLVAEGGVHSYEDLMARLSISQPMLEAMLDDLGRLGYLRPVNDRCEGQCSGCSVGRCSVSGPGRLWSLTDKGAKAASHLSP